MNQKLHVLIIEDDFRVAEINRQLVKQVEPFQVMAVAKTGDEAIAFLKDAKQLPDLILLDVFIPDRNGLELFWEIRKNFYQVDIIMLSAAKEVATIKETLSGGIFDYIVKPVDFERFEKTLIRFREQKTLLASKGELDQSDIDRLIGISNGLPTSSPNKSEELLPKSIDQLTLESVMDILHASAGEGVNALETGKALGVSRSTARRYLEHLVANGEAKAQLNYGIGRPERRYIPWTK
ncbi:two-component system, CitB family, response regulator CitT [Planomicrobium soli]|uniref:Transcriptional regulatory protein n=1 Tax=Planomicrobium soli TaxID=1176648 RepID=A0A2P8H6K6_9BACL|nr:response regulator [Planomicrobium soli]PSL41852.1 two-component system, CitB family, response regulator CitT [Planomicrobium soli]